MNSERYLDIIQSAIDNWKISRRAATLIITGLCVMAKNTDEPDICRYQKIIGILMGLNAAGAINEYQYEELHQLVDQIDTNIRDSRTAYGLIEETFAEVYEGREAE